ncbi:hypothetical protein PSACC_00859 [Paramicrosporidium saccamoebae]|uniref:CCHC-type domain-containing protein n=1 Tax=Paramicrosporidium saccamoebae TaxID=1246581 RepID=A0A2H9TNT6_9FUNG|nr:hypothetical protein PSACC_00859 [Paramicrosporidium saccamoebae]
MTRYTTYKKRFNTTSITEDRLTQDEARHIEESKAQSVDALRSSTVHRSKPVCLKCRKRGHSVKYCPAGASSICYNCGSHTHTLKACRQPRSNELPYASCYVCGGTGHLAGQCPKNERGIYPRGGGCRFCGSKQHLARDCKPTREETTVVGASNDPRRENPDEDLMYESLTKIQEEKNAKRENTDKAPKKKKAKVVSPNRFTGSAIVSWAWPAIKLLAPDTVRQATCDYRSNRDGARFVFQLAARMEGEFERKLYVGTVPVPMDDGAGVMDETSLATSYFPFISGHTEISSGIIHVFREPAQTRSMTSRHEDGERMRMYHNREEDGSLGVFYSFLDNTVVLVLAVPSIMSPADLLHFLGRDFAGQIERIRLLKDAAPNRYMALIKLESEDAATRLREARDGRKFSPLEPETCHIVNVSSVEITTRAAVLEPLFDETEFCNLNGDQLSSVESCDFVEIPTCPVCLERIDSAATGIMIVVWCGRYHSGHARDHFCDTGHCFALEETKTDPDYYASLLVAQLESQRMFYEERLGAMEVGFIDRVEKLGREHITETRKLSQEAQANRIKITEQNDVFHKERVDLQSRINTLQVERTALLRELENERAVETNMSY